MSNRPASKNLPVQCLLIQKTPDHLVPLNSRPVRPGIKARKGIAQHVQSFARQLALREQDIQHAIFGQSAHPDEPIHRDASSAEAKRAVGPLDERNDTPVDIGRQPAVEAQFLAAIALPRFERGEIERRQLYRFFHLVDAVADQKDPGRMRLPHTDVRSGRAVARSLLQE